MPIDAGRPAPTQGADHDNDNQETRLNGMNTRRTALARIAAAASGAWALGGPSLALGQGTSLGDWPNKPVRVFVPSGAGSQTDLFARFIGDALAKRFGQPFIIDNKPGASGNIGSMAVVKSPADGHTLLFSAASFTVVPAALRANMPYDLVRDLAPIVKIGAGGLMLAVAGDSPLRTAKDVFELARREPGKHGYGTTGVASTAHLIMASLLSRQGLEMPHVPYKASSEVLRDLTGGVLQIGWIDTTSSLGMVQAGKVRPLAMGATMRMPQTPQVATLNELGYPMDLDGWLGLFAPAGTPAPIVRAINAEVNRLIHSEEGNRRLGEMNVANPPPLSPEQFAERIRLDVQGWKQMAIDNNIKPEA